MAFIAKITPTNNSTAAPLTTALYGTCDTAKSTVAKVVTCADFDKLIPGVTIRVKFDNENTASSPTLNVNSTGAKAIRAYGTTAANSNAIGSWLAGEVVEFIYLEISSTGYWYLTSSHAMFTTVSINNPTVTSKSPSKISAWTTNTPTAVTLGTAFSVPNVTAATDVTVSSVKTNTSKTIKQWTFADVSCSLVTKSDVTVPVVSSNTSVDASKLGSDGTGAYVSAASGTISEGVLTLSVTSTNATKVTATNTVFGTATTASAVTITSKTASKATAADDISASLIVTESKTASKVTLGTAFSIPNVESVTPGTAATLTYAAESCSLVSTSAATVIKLR